MYDKIAPYLTAVRKPARYTGGEFGAVMKDKQSVEVRAAFCFPDTYEIGMSCLGMRIIYEAMNRLPYVWCERAFAPWEDMRSLLQHTKTPLWALESGDSLDRFDLLAFTLQYELSYTNVLNMLDLANIPLRREDRNESHPLVAAGGPCCYHPEPMSDFIDLFFVGDGEEVITEFCALLRDAKQSGGGREELLRQAAGLEGVYVPSLYRVDYHDDGTVAAVTPTHDSAPAVVRKRIVYDMDKAVYPLKPIMPSTEIVHDRVMLELFRGCTRGCRFCQAGYTTRPVREKSAEVLNRQALEASRNAGNDEIGLISLSTSDYSQLEPLCDAMLDWCTPRRISLSLPSLRADSFSAELLDKVQRVRKSGLTFAPEAGTPRLRNVINKNLEEQDLMNALETAFAHGYHGVKLYYMIGLPTETEEDIQGIADQCSRVWQLWRRLVPDRSRSLRLGASASCFVPKPHTAFQWEPMDAPAALEHKTRLLRGAMRKQVSFRWHEPDASYMEGVLCRGDRRMGAVILRAYQAGCRMDGWSEHFSLERWRAAFAAEGLDPDFYALRRRGDGEVFPWSHISCLLSEDYLRRERDKAYEGAATPDCRRQCSRCSDAFRACQTSGKGE